MRGAFLLVIAGCQSATSAPTKMTSSNATSSNAAPSTAADDGPPCLTVVRRMAEINHAKLLVGGFSGDDLARIDDRVRLAEQALVRACADDHWSVELRRCVMTVKASDLAGADHACEKLITPEQVKHVLWIRDKID